MLFTSFTVKILRMLLMINTLKSLGAAALISFVLSGCQTVPNSNIGKEIKTENTAGGGGGSY